ncbi:MAG: BolA family protein [Xanthomonadales bacterium]|nr:BolA family protein [Xanthomonadales bacterium]
MTWDREALLAEVRARIERGLAPLRLELRDESERHRGHPGHGGGAHLALEVVSERFRGLAPLARHRLVHALLADLLPGAIHALALRARAPEE